MLQHIFRALLALLQHIFRALLALLGFQKKRAPSDAGVRQDLSDDSLPMGGRFATGGYAATHNYGPPQRPRNQRRNRKRERMVRSHGGRQGAQLRAKVKRARGGR